MQAQHVLDRPALGRDGGWQAIGDPRHLGPLLELGEVVVPAARVHLNDRDEAAPGHEPDDEQPPLELRHQGGRIGLRGVAGPAYTRPR
jgi:hypothetical protein